PECHKLPILFGGTLAALRDWPIERAQDFCDFGQWPLDYQTISINRHSGTVTFSAGHGGVAQLYLKVSGERIDLSWSIADFYSGMT
ncbi:asparagine synthase, partial [Rhizobium ruizarguesonis]